MKQVSQENVTKEMFRLMNEHSEMELTMTPFEWVTIVGFLQLAMRHPQVGETEKRTVLQTGAKIQAMMAEASEDIGLMLEMGWHEKYDVKSDRPMFNEGEGGETVVGIIALDGDGGAVLDAAYDLPCDYEDDRWQYECLVYGIGDNFYVCHAFWAVPSFSLRQIYRICLGLLRNMTPIDPTKLTWLNE